MTPDPDRSPRNSETLSDSVDRRQELVVIGAKLAPDLLERLDRCCLSNAEIALGPESWLGFDDPFPPWRIAEQGDDDTVIEEDELP